MGDPYARLVLDPNNDKYIPSSVYPGLPEYPSQVKGSVSLSVYQENINDYAWTDDDFLPAEKKDLVIYELLFRDFTGTEGEAKGNGTVSKAIEKISYLKQLGVNAVGCSRSMNSTATTPGAIIPTSTSLPTRHTAHPTTIRNSSTHAMKTASP